MREKKMRAKLEDFLQEVCEKTITNNQYPVLTSSKSGLFLQSDYFNKQVASKDNTGYKIIRRGQFTYRAMSDTGEFFPNMLECADVGIVSPAYPVFEIIKQDQIVPEYLKYYFKSNRFQNSISTFAQGSTRTSVKFGKLKKVSIELPEIKKQYQIIQTLDLLRTIINNRKKEVLELDELIRARFVEMFGDPQINPFGWDIVNISEVVGGKVSNGFFAKRDDYADDGNVSILGVANIVNRMYSKVDELPRTTADYKDIEKFGVKYGDMLFCRSSLVAEGIGKASIIPEDVKENILFECHVIRLPLDLSKCVPEFMQTLSTMDFFRNQVIAQSKTATMTTIGQDGILKTDIILPPIDRQREFYDFINQIDKSKATVQKALDETQLLFDSLMQQYFG